MTSLKEYLLQDTEETPKESVSLKDYILQEESPEQVQPQEIQESIAEIQEKFDQLNEKDVKELTEREQIAKNLVSNIDQDSFIDRIGRMFAMQSQMLPSPKEAVTTGKGVLSGVTLGASEFLPGLQLSEGESEELFQIADAIGTIFPAGYFTKLALKIPGSKQFLKRMLGFAVMGSTKEALTEKARTGEFPDAKQLGITAGEWAIMSAVFELAGKGVELGVAINNIAHEMGVPVEDVIKTLGEATKNWVRGVRTPKTVLETPGKAPPEKQIPKLREDIDVKPKEVKPAEEVKTKAEPKDQPKTEKPKKTEGKELSEEMFGKKTKDLTKQEKEMLVLQEIINDPTYPEEIREDAKKALETFKEQEKEDVKEQKVEEPTEKPKQPEIKDKKVEKPKKKKITSSDIEKILENHPRQKLDLDTKQEIESYVHDSKFIPLSKALDTIKSVEKRKSGEVDFDKYFKLKKEIKKYIFQNHPDNFKFGSESQKKAAERNLEIRERALEKARKSFENSLKKLEGTVKPLLSEAQPKKRVPIIRKTLPKKPIMGKKQAVARSKIIDGFRKAFKDPIRLGKLGMRNALGIHKLWSRVTRLLKANDVETAAHEIGHNLHTVLYDGGAKTPREQRINVTNALRPYLNELKPIARYEPFGMEGFAEFTRMYVTNPEVAKDLAPKFYQKFEADLEAKYPELLKALLDAREYYARWLEADPLSRQRAQTAYETPSKIEEFKQNITGGWDKYQTLFLDEFFPAKRLVSEAFGISLTDVENLKDIRNVYMGLRLLKGAIGKADVFVLHETFDPLTLKKTGEGLRQILKMIPDDEQSFIEFNDYLIARRDIELAKRGIETGLEYADSVANEKMLRPKYEKAADELDKYLNNLLDYSVKCQVISPKTRDLFKKKNLMYVPFQRDMKLAKQIAGSKRLQAGKDYHKIKGSQRNIIPPMLSILKNTYSIIMNGEKNLVGLRFAELAKMKNMGMFIEKLPTPIKLKAKVLQKEMIPQVVKHLKEIGQYDLLEKTPRGWKLSPEVEEILPEAVLKFGAGQYSDKDNVITVFKEGKPQYYEVSDDLYDMWKGGTSPYVSGLITKTLSFPARTLRAGAILNPKFWQKNFIRDTWESWLFTRYGKGIKDPQGLFIDTVWQPLAMMSQAAKHSELYVQWMKAGGGMSTMQSLDRPSLQKKMREVRHGLSKKQVIKYMRVAGEITEESNRLAEFARALEVQGQTRLGQEMAAFASRDLSVDFAKMGTLVKALNQINPFFAVRVQGTSKFIRTLANKDQRKEAILRLLSFIALPSAFLYWYNKDDERIDELHEEEKDLNFCFFVGDTLYKIPNPFEPGIVMHGATQRMLRYFLKKDPNAFEGFFGSIKDGALPSFIPTAALPFIEKEANKNFFTGAPIIPKDKEDLIAKFQYKRGTSTTARLVGRAIAYMAGQDTRSGYASPAVIDHFINAWTGGLGRMIVEILDESLEKSGIEPRLPGPNRPITQRLGLEAFTERYPRAHSKSLTEFYENYSDAVSRQKSYKWAEKREAAPTEEIEKGYKRIEKIYDMDSLKAAYDAIQNCQKSINNIWLDPSIKPEEKQPMIDELYLQMIDVAKDVNKDLIKYRLVQKKK